MKENVFGKSFSLYMYSWKYCSISPKRPEAPIRNKDGSNHSLPNSSFTSINQRKASSHVLIPPAGFNPTFK